MWRTAIAAIAACGIFQSVSAHAQTATQDINITATVAGACTVNGAATGTPGSATIPTTGGVVDTTPITPIGSPFANVACNSPSTLQLTSLNGGVFNSSTLSGFDNVIDYTASATWNSVTATIDTSTNGASSVGGNETGSPESVATSGSGSLSVTITPIINGQPLVTGSYADTLRITLMPQ